MPPCPHYKSVARRPYFTCPSLIYRKQSGTSAPAVTAISANKRVSAIVLASITSPRKTATVQDRTPLDLTLREAQANTGNSRCPRINPLAGAHTSGRCSNQKGAANRPRAPLDGFSRGVFDFPPAIISPRLCRSSDRKLRFLPSTSRPSARPSRRLTTSVAALLDIPRLGLSPYPGPLQTFPLQAASVYKERRSAREPHRPSSPHSPRRSSCAPAPAEPSVIQPAVLPALRFLQARFIAVGAVSDSMSGDGIK